MKKIFTLFAILLASVTGFCQITLDQSSFANTVVTDDSVIRIIGPFPTMQAGANQEWDFTFCQFENTIYYTLQPNGTHPSFPGATFNAPRRYTLGTNKYTFDTKRWSGITSIGLERIGEEIERQGISLTPGNPNDSIIVLPQDVIYSSPYPLIKFPATMGSNWSATFDFIVNMELTYGTYVQAPMTYKVTTEYTFTCPGDGTALIPWIREPGKVSEEKVLLVRIVGKTKDSFFVNGVPADPSLLSSLGFVQGTQATNHWDELFRANEVSPLVIYSYGANSSWQGPTSGDIHILRPWHPVAVENVKGNKNTTLYPNPVSNGQTLNVTLPSAGKHYTYSIRSINGTVLSSGNAAANNSTLQVSLPSSTTSGFYWISVFEKDKMIMTQPFRFQQ